MTECHDTLLSEIPIDGDLIRSAADLCERHALRGYDAVHLAALLQAGGPAHVTFACWDGDLRARPQTRLQARSSLTAARLQRGHPAIDAIALWLGLRNAASSAEMQSGRLVASGFADGRTRKDRDSSHPG